MVGEKGKFCGKKFQEPNPLRKNPAVLKIFSKKFPERESLKSEHQKFSKKNSGAKNFQIKNSGAKNFL